MENFCSPFPCFSLKKGFKLTVFGFLILFAILLIGGVISSTYQFWYSDPQQIGRAHV